MPEENNRQVRFPEIASPVDLLVIAGEHSGDEHAAKLLAELRRLHPELNACALGGDRLEEAGAQILFDLPAHSVVGLAEVLRHYGFFKKLFDEAVRWIRVHRPKVVCFVDYPGFNIRLAERLYQEGLAKRSGGDITLFYYISPQIWAWKAKRRFKMARILDALAVIFPFELESYADTQLNVRFVGHPFVTSTPELALQYDPQGQILLLPGSRKQPIQRILPGMLAAFKEYRKQHPQEQAVILYPDDEIRRTVSAIVDTFGAPAGTIELRPAQERIVAKAVLTSSGTMSLQCALAGIPGAICYRAHPMTYLIGRLLVKVPYLGIANLIMPEDPPYPEFIQGEASPERLARELHEAAENPARANAAQASARLLHERLDAPSQGSAAEWINDLLQTPPDQGPGETSRPNQESP